MSTLLAKARTNREQGFTLIELLVVIVIIGILAAIAIPVFNSQRARAQDAKSVSEARSTLTAVESLAAGSTGGVLVAAPTALQLSDEGATNDQKGATAAPAAGVTQDSLTTTVVFTAASGTTPGSYVVKTTNTAGKATLAASTSNPATFTQSGSTSVPATATVTLY